MSDTVRYISKEISDVMNLRFASQFVTETKEKCIFILVLIIMAGGCSFSFFWFRQYRKDCLWIGLDWIDWRVLVSNIRY